MKTRRKKKLRVTNKRRFCFFCLVMIFLLCCGFSSVKGYVAPEQNVVSVYVKPGDTLWSIASEHNETKKDVRKLIRDIQRLNEMENAVIQVGDEIIIPIS